jgi:transcription elongation factor GreA
MPKEVLLTAEGLKKLQDELKVLKEERRKEVIERIQEAVAHGDLSENADYAQAKEEQAFIEGRIQEIEEMIKNAQIIAHSHEQQHGQHRLNSHRKNKWQRSEIYDCRIKRSQPGCRENFQ